ncbi:MAG: hypothetical protein DRP11_04240 [Candidatus Aenigmatarchaeota archaeon]|nr:MAG: hypothetical protein DRP11_04240 [Candidatus Aenigmarchaeota archaeon]
MNYTVKSINPENFTVEIEFTERFKKDNNYKEFFDTKNFLFEERNLKKIKENVHLRLTFDDSLEKDFKSMIRSLGLADLNFKYYFRWPDEEKEKKEMVDAYYSYKLVEDEEHYHNPEFRVALRFESITEDGMMVSNSIRPDGYRYVSNAVADILHLLYPSDLERAKVLGKPAVKKVDGSLHVYPLENIPNVLRTGKRIAEIISSEDDDVPEVSTDINRLAVDDIKKSVYITELLDLVNGPL